MPSSVPHDSPACPRLNVELKPRMAKASFRFQESDENRKACGLILQRALSLLGWTNDRLALQLRKDPSLVGKWTRGETPFHLEAVWAVEEMRQPLLVAQAEACGQNVTIETIVRVRRIA